MAGVRNRSRSKCNPLATGCIKFLASAGIVAYFISKIVMGAKYKSDCPVQKLVPICVILSGCISFLLFAFTCKPSNRDQENDKKVDCLRKCYCTIGCVGATLTLVVLVTGTVIVSQVLHEVKFSNKPCGHLQNETVFSGIGLNKTSQSSADILNSTFYTTPSVRTTHVSSILTSSRTQSTNKTNIEHEHVLDNANDIDSRVCDLCSDTILMFAAVTVGVDWFFAICLSVLACFLRFHNNHSRRQSLI